MCEYTHSTPHKWVFVWDSPKILTFFWTLSIFRIIGIIFCFRVCCYRILCSVLLSSIPEGKLKERDHWETITMGNETMTIRNGLIISKLIIFF